MIYKREYRVGAFIRLLGLLVVSCQVRPKMKPVAFLMTTLVVSVCCARPQHYDQNPDSQTTIVEQENNIGHGNYNFAYKTSDGSYREEKAELKNPGSKDETMVVQGSYAFVGTDGNTYTVNYIADENGYRATGNHLPKTERNHR